MNDQPTIHICLTEPLAKESTQVRAEYQILEKAHILATIPKDLGQINFYELKEFVRFYQRRAKDMGISLTIDADVASQLVYLAYWAGFNPQVQASVTGASSAQLKLVVPVSGTETEITIADVNMWQDGNRLSEWMEWGYGIVDNPCVTFASAPALEAWVPSRIPISDWRMKCQSLEMENV